MKDKVVVARFSRHFSIRELYKVLTQRFSLSLTFNSTFNLCLLLSTDNSSVIDDWLCQVSICRFCSLSLKLPPRPAFNLVAGSTGNSKIFSALKLNGSSEM